MNLAINLLDYYLLQEREKLKKWLREISRDHLLKYGVFHSKEGVALRNTI